MLRRDFFVAPNGDDAAPGTTEAPRKSIQSALQLLAEHRSHARQVAGDWTVWMSAGTYRIRDPIALGPSCAGVPNARTIIRAIEGQRARVTGAEAVTALTLSWF